MKTNKKPNVLLMLLFFALTAFACQANTKPGVPKKANTTAAAAIITGAAYYQHGAGLILRAYDIGYRFSGFLHQRFDGNACGNGGLIGGLGLFGGEQCGGMEHKTIPIT